MSETDLSRAITKALQGLGYIVIRVQSGKVRVAPRGSGITPYWVQFADKGTPDKVVLGPYGVTTWLEVKTTKGRLSPEQKAWHERAFRMGHRAVVVRSVEQAICACRVADMQDYIDSLPADFAPIAARRRRSK